jgi:hypothetical protein
MIKTSPESVDVLEKVQDFIVLYWIETTGGPLKYLALVFLPLKPKLRPLENLKFCLKYFCALL